MTARADISPKLQGWARQAGYSLTLAADAHDGRLLIWATGGEVRIYVAATSDAWFAVTDSSRFGPEQFVLAAPLIKTIEKYFFGRLGQGVRSRQGLPRLRIPGTAERIFPGFNIDNRPFENAERMTLIDPDGGVVAVSSGDRITGTLDLVRLSHCMVASDEDIMDSFLSPDGKPLFGLSD